MGNSQSTIEEFYRIHLKVQGSRLGKEGQPGWPTSTTTSTSAPLLGALGTPSPASSLGKPSLRCPARATGGKGVAGKVGETQKRLKGLEHWLAGVHRSPTGLVNRTEASGQGSAARKTGNKMAWKLAQAKEGLEDSRRRRSTTDKGGGGFPSQGSLSRKERKQQEKGPKSMED